MTDLATHLDRLGLVQYLDAFIGEGFDTWDTLCDIQETDLEALNVKLGHRRKLQRAIADYRGISVDRLLLGSPAAQDGPPDLIRSTEGSQSTVTGKESVTGLPTETKRKYRRHPKPDEHAPEKPPSAYVLFSNQVREEVKADNLSFTEIAKLVGDRWQKLDPSQKEPFESRAASLKEQYNVQLSTYKKTDEYKEYTQYLNDFKAKHGPQTETKRPKLDPQSSGSISATSVDIPDNIPVTSGHGRVGSISSMSAASLASSMTSPPGMALAQVTSLPGMTGLGASTGPRGLPSLHRPSSPQTLQYRGGPRLIGQLSSHSSTSEDSVQVPFDALSRTATLSLNTPPTGTPPLPAHGLSSGRPEQGNSSEGFSWASRASQTGHQQGSITPSGPSLLGTGITLPSPTFSSDSWRDRGIEWTRQLQTSPSTSAGMQTSALPLPSLLGPDRVSELSHSQAQRTLPPLRQNAPLVPSPGSYQSTSSAGQLSRQATEELERRFATTYESTNRQLDRNENEAASTLAGLAARPDHGTPHSRSHDRHRPQ